MDVKLKGIWGMRLCRQAGAAAEHCIRMSMLSTHRDASAPGIPPGQTKSSVYKAEAMDEDKEGVY